MFICFSCHKYDKLRGAFLRVRRGRQRGVCSGAEPDAAGVCWGAGGAGGPAELLGISAGVQQCAVQEVSAVVLLY